MVDEFDYSLRDSQATSVEPVAPERFDIGAFADYEQRMLERCRHFEESSSGVAVFRRMRVGEVFSADSRDMARSLAWQLGGLTRSMEFEADIPNFIEPWYGIGTVAAAFGFDYRWDPGQAPAVDGHFDSAADLLAAPAVPIRETRIGRHTLEMIEYFLDKTRGRIPMSYCDVQSPLNIVGNIVDINRFYMDFLLDPEVTRHALDRVADLLIDFTREQQRLIGDVLAQPGHGFASCRSFRGFGQSDDNIVMMPADLYGDMAVPAMVKVGNAFGGTVFHSCGNWSDKRDEIVRISNVRMADGAFSKATDPDPNPTAGFGDTFANTGVVLHARIVGPVEVIEQKVRELWRPGLKLIVVTYCKTPEEQALAYERIHSICV